MTSSAKPTRSASAPTVKPLHVLAPAAVIGVAVLLGVNNWQLSSPTFFLTLGWLGIIGTAAFLWNSAFVVFTETPEADVGFELPTRRAELLQEKKALLKALKEIEFDHQLGKMSAADAKEISALYRHQAIAIIKELDRSGADTDMPASELVERELKARLEVDKIKRKKKPKAKPEKKKGETSDSDKSEADSKEKSKRPKSDDKGEEKPKAGDDEREEDSK